MSLRDHRPARPPKISYPADLTRGTIGVFYLYLRNAKGKLQRFVKFLAKDCVKKCRYLPEHSKAIAENLQHFFNNWARRAVCFSSLEKVL
jgi:hypothetical protein